MDVLERISCHNFVVLDGYAYFSNWSYNGFFKVEILTGKTFFLGHFEGEKLFQGNIHWDLLLKDGKIYFMPYTGRHVHIYKLFDQSMECIEVISDSEEAFTVREVVLGENFFVFKPMEENCLARKVDLETLVVTNMNGRMNIRGERRIQHKKEDSFPASMFMEDYHIERADRASWKKISDGNWYGFLPMGRHMLRYSEEMRKLYLMPLTVVNNDELEKYLHKVKQSLLQSVMEEGIMGLPIFLDEIVKGGTHKISGLESNKNTGKEIWKHINERIGR